MKRISWTLTNYVLPNFKIYDKSTSTSTQQIPITSPPSDNTYFIGVVGTIEAPTEKLLCYHTTNGKYIVIFTITGKNDI